MVESQIESAKFPKCVKSWSQVDKLHTQVFSYSCEMLSESIRTNTRLHGGELL